MVFVPFKMNTNCLFRRKIVINSLIRRLSTTLRFSCSKNSDDAGKSDANKFLRNEDKSESTISDKKKDDELLGFLDHSKLVETESSQFAAKVNKSRFAEAFEKYTNLDFNQENKIKNEKEEPLESVDPVTSDVNLSGFAKAFKKFSEFDDSDEHKFESDSDSDSEKEQQTFASLLRNSKFIDLGDPEGKVVIGSIYHIVGNDLYIDFGWKFPTVCQRPPQGGENYIRGATVRLLIKDLELSTRFLGSTTDITLREADCVLLGLVKPRSSRIV